MTGPAASAPPRLSLTSTEESLRRLDLAVGRRLDGLLQGEHLGLLPGPGTEPAESRLYRVGDDVRRMDWAVTARTTVPHVHDMTADRELETWALVDMSASLDFGTADCEKRDLAVAAVAAVGYLTARAGNRVGAVILRDGGRPRVVPARPGREAFSLLLRTLVTEPRSAGGAPTDLAAGLVALGRPPRRRGLAVVVSDFLSGSTTVGGTAAPDWGRPLRALAARHQVLCVEVLDPRELELPAVGVLTLVDPETGRTREVSTGRRLRERYAQAAAAQREGVARAVRAAGADHLRLRTDSDWLREVVRHVLRTRRGRFAAAAQAGGVRR